MGDTVLSVLKKGESNTFVLITSGCEKTRHNSETESGKII